MEQKVDGLVEQVTRLETSVLGTISNHETRIDSLESTRDEGKGGARLISVAKGAATFILAMLAALGITKAGV